MEAVGITITVIDMLSGLVPMIEFDIGESKSFVDTFVGDIHAGLIRKGYVRADGTGYGNGWQFHSGYHRYATGEGNDD